MERLESIKLTSSSIASLAWHWDSQNIFDPALNLRSFHTQGLWAPNMPWERLEDISIVGRIGRMDGIELLRNASQLRELEIPDEFLPQLPVVPPTALVHNSLQILCISDPSILGLLQAPSLIELEFFDYVVSEPNRDEFATISAFLVHSPLLAKLAITVDYLDADLIRVELASRMTRLRELELTIRCNYTEDGSCIFVDFTQPVLVILVQLTIEGNLQIRAKELVDMLTYRSVTGSKLQHVTIKCTQFIASDVERNILLGLKENGLDLKIFGK